MKKKIKDFDPKDIKMVKMPSTPYMAELNRQMEAARTEEQRSAVFARMQEYMDKLGLTPKS
jgi:hypothetical protein